MIDRKRLRERLAELRQNQSRVGGEYRLILTLEDGDALLDTLDRYENALQHIYWDGCDDCNHSSDHQLVRHLEDVAREALNPKEGD